MYATETIEAYLRGALPADEMAAFGARLATDAELSEKVARCREEMNALELLVERDLRTKMQQWERGAVFQESAPSGGMRIWKNNLLRWAAAAVLILVVFGWWLLRDSGESPPPMVQAPVSPTEQAGKLPTPPVKKTQPAEEKTAQRPELPPEKTPSPVAPDKPSAPATPDYEALAAQLYRENDFALGGGSSASNDPGTPAGSSLDRQAYQDFQQKDYSAVIDKLKPLLKKNANSLKNRELMAHALYQSGRYDEAIPYFRQLANSRETSVAQRAEWGLVLTLLHKMPAQQKFLQQVLDRILADPGHPYYNKARSLEQALKR